jgi:hypothetical protein
VRALGPIRSVVNITGAFCGLILKPYAAYRSDKGSVLKGLGEGVFKFYSVVTEESSFITQKVLFLIY